MAAAAVHLAGARDVGASIIADRASGRPQLRLLSGPTGLAVRMVRPTVVGWWVAIGVSGLLYGMIAKSAGGTISGSSVTKIFAKLGAPGTGAEAVLGVCFLILAVLVAFVGAGQLTAARSEESSGRLDHVLVAPVSRARWLGGRLLVAFAVLLVSGLAAGVFAWLGAASQHAGVSFMDLLEAGINLVPPAITIMGVGVLVFGFRPRLTSIVIYVLLGWSLLIEVVGGIGATSHWVLDTSVFHQMASAPAVAPNWKANAVMTGIGVVGALLGGLAFRRRDLQGE
jgi:ABC-2 type transport system permease protein